ncbi:5' exonuclease Apollo [Antennarius striatus]|uniref:5' exonuclease Apollo n=1 Tax=Antennarius striatus TaxID=241820 RepID=UPI0035B1790D
MPANGKVIPHTPLAVDFWQVRKCPGTRLFFLSHMHSDHTVGLTSTWSNRPIYCSPTTSTLLKLKLQVKEQWIHPLELGEPYVLPLDDIGKERLTVTLIEANHCPGAVMFLFEGYFGSILYTGDFRYSPSMLREPCLRTNITIDVLYLDNTNCDPNRTLPSRQRATQEIKEIIRSHPSHDVVIGIYTLGKESLLLELAIEFKTWIEVSFERMETLKALELPDVFTTEAGAGRIRVVEQSEICPAMLNQWNREQPTLAIVPTSRPLVSLHPNVHVVPYSDHSSYQELEDFVAALKPNSIVPIVGNYVPAGLCALAVSKKRQDILVPESVQHYMSRQPEIQVSSLAYTSFNHRYLQPCAPKGVIFESPLQKSCKEAAEADQDISEEDLDTESSEKDSESVLVDMNRDFVPEEDRSEPSDVWNLNIVQTVSEDIANAESVSMSQLTQSNFAPVDILSNIKACLMPVSKTRKSFQTTAKTIKAASHCSSLHSRYGNAQNNSILSGGESMSLQSRNGINHDEEDMSNSTSMSQLSRHGLDKVDELSLLSSLDNGSCRSPASLSVLQEEIDRIENSVLNNLFAEEDLKFCGILHQDFVKLFTLCPTCNFKK